MQLQTVSVDGAADGGKNAAEGRHSEAEQRGAERSRVKRSRGE
jgi:hypothetical protein